MRRRPCAPPLAVLLALVSWPGLEGVRGQEAEWFPDVASEVGLDFTHFNGMVGELYFSEIMGSGVALLDYDRDGDLDVYWVQGAMLGSEERPEDAVFAPPPRLTDRLYRADTGPRGDGSAALRFVDVTEGSGLNALGYGMGVAVGDVDNDGWPDLYLTNLGANELWRNQGDGTFADVTAATGTGDRRWGVSASFTDYDGDGWLDLYVGNYVGFRLTMQKACFSPTGISDYCGPLAFEAEPDVLYRNRGDGTFEDVTSRLGLESAPPGSALGVVGDDFNGDGRLDFYVANDQVPNRLWIQTAEGNFVDDALMTGTAVNEEGQPQASMGVVAADFNRDGAIDLFMSHLTRETNTLYVNDGSGLFRDSTRGSGLDRASWQATGFGIGLLDFDLDGWLDLFIANGTVKRIDELVAAGDPYPLRQPDLLFRNLGQGSFADVTDAAGINAGSLHVGRGVATGDIDNDGDPDLVVSNNSGPGSLRVNRAVRAGNWLGLRVLGEAGGDLVGAGVRVSDGGAFAVSARSHTDGSYASANDARLLFGLGAAQAGLDVEVIVPSGARRRFTAVPDGRWLTVPLAVGADR